MEMIMKKKTAFIKIFIFFGLLFYFTSCSDFFDVIGSDYQGTFNWDYNSISEANIIAVIDGNSITLSGDSAGINTGSISLGRHVITSTGTEKLVYPDGSNAGSRYVLYKGNKDSFASFSGKDKDKFHIWGFYGNFERKE